MFGIYENTHYKVEEATVGQGPSATIKFRFQWYITWLCSEKMKNFKINGSTEFMKLRVRLNSGLSRYGNELTWVFFKLYNI